MALPRVLGNTRSLFRRDQRSSQNYQLSTSFAQRRDRLLASAPIGRRKSLATVLITDEEFNFYTLAEKRLREAIWRAAGVLALAVVGYNSPIIIGFIIIIQIQSAYRTFLSQSWRTWQRERRLDTNLITGLTVIIAVLTGYVIFSALIGIVAVAAAALTVRVKGDTHMQLINVFKSQPLFVWVIKEGEEVQIPFRALAVGDTLVINTGNVIPADGIIIEGDASVDQQALTGESQPVEKEVGDEVLASTVVLSGRILVNVERAGTETTVAQIGKVLNNTIRSKSEVEFKIERFVDRTVAPTLVVSALVVPVLGFPGAIAILLAHFRRRPALYVSLAMLNYFRILSENQIFVKNGRALDDLPDVDTVIFDKTGTLTVAQPHVKQIFATAEADEETVLRLAAAAENHQHHPIALAILEYAEAQGVNVPDVQDMKYELGFGLAVEADGHHINVGSRRFMDRLGIAVPEDIQAHEEHSYRDGHTIVMVARDHQLIGAIELIPTVRPEARMVIDQLRKMGVKETVIISGDHEQPTRKLAQDLGIDRYYAQQLPQEKAAIIQQLVDEGRVVCYIGDGINDAIALQAAQVSVSMSGASTVATDSAQIILTGGDLYDLPVLFAYGEEYKQVARVIVVSMIGLGTVGMVGAVLPFAISFAFAAANISLIGGLFLAMAPYAIHQYRRLNNRPVVALPAPAEVMTIEGSAERV